MIRLKPFFFTIFSLIFIIFTNCKSDNGKCKFGDPTAIFSDSMKMVKKHHFEIKDKTGIELVAFSNGMNLEVEQSGCNDIQQQFTFILPGDFSKSDDVFWKTLAIKNFRIMASLSPKLEPFNNWATAIENVGSKLKIAEPVEVDKNVSVKIDKVLSENQGLLVVLLAQK